MLKNTFVPQDEKIVTLSIIIPIFNEEECILELYKQLKEVLNKIIISYEILFVNDGSEDGSIDKLKSICSESDGTVKAINFSRNFGHQIAITAGMNHAHGQAVVVLDADLQDPPSLIEDFILKWNQGYEIVYGQRIERQGETFFKKISAKLFYKVLRRITSLDIPENVGDFYLLDRKVVDIFNRVHERHRFIRGLISWVGFKKTGVDYVRKSRYAGKTKFSLWKMIKFSIDAMTSFSFFPLKVVSWLGLLFSLLSFLALANIFYLKIFTDKTVLGWSSIMAALLMIGGIQLLAIGIIGEYIARIGDDVKSRPLYTISEILE